MDFGIGAWRRGWIAMGLLAWAAAMIIHDMAWAGVDLPDAVGWTLFVGIFPLFLCAVFTHPRAVVRGTRALLGPIEAARGAKRSYIALALGTLAWSLAASAFVGVHRVRMGHHLAPAELVTLTGVAATFYAASVMIQSSARAAERVSVEPDPPAARHEP